jgi:hypothetical protein
MAQTEEFMLQNVAYRPTVYINYNWDFAHENMKNHPQK